MKKLLFLLISGLFFLASCKDDDLPSNEPEYHAHIHSPAINSAFTVDDVLHIDIEFEEHNGGTVHHINIRIFEKILGNVIYNEPDEAHVHQTGIYSFEDNFILNVSPGTYVLEAKVWGHDEGLYEVVKTVEFQVNP